MESLYSDDQYCLEFNNEEILNWLVDPFIRNTNMPLEVFAKDQKQLKTSSDKIRHVFIDEKRDFFLSFLGFQTSLFIFDEEIMFIDDMAKNHIVSSHTYGNIVYEGNLRDKTHKEILQLIYDISSLLLDARHIEFQETKVSQVGIQYPKCNYNVKIYSNSSKSAHFDNISFRSVDS